MKTDGPKRLGSSVACKTDDPKRNEFRCTAPSGGSNGRAGARGLELAEGFVNGTDAYDAVVIDCFVGEGKIPDACRSRETLDKVRDAKVWPRAVEFSGKIWSVFGSLGWRRCRMPPPPRLFWTRYAPRP